MPEKRIQPKPAGTGSAKGTTAAAGVQKKSLVKRSAVKRSAVKRSAVKRSAKKH